MAQSPTLEGKKLAETIRVIANFCLKAATKLDVKVKQYQRLWKQDLKYRIFLINLVVIEIDKL